MLATRSKTSWDQVVLLLVTLSELLHSLGSSVSLSLKNEIMIIVPLHMVILVK